MPTAYSRALSHEEIAGKDDLPFANFEENEELSNLRSARLAPLVPRILVLTSKNREQIARLSIHKHHKVHDHSR